jgi:NAD(P)-dependent dehydrogenase (short-subunit alcohol dehydrogenase family)
MITGASRGIGEALVEGFKGRGFRVAACARGEISTPHADLAFPCDVSRPDQVRAGVAHVVERFGRIDALINNAGKAGTNSLSPEDSDDLWHEIIDVNLNGTYYFTKHVLPHLPSDGTGRIINIASVLALKGVPDQTAYCAAKHGVLGFTRALSHHVAPRRITVNAICPGWVRTEMARGRMKELGMTEASLEAGVPLNRFIEPREVAELALYLASDAGAGITGQALTMDGGFLA